MFCDFRHGLLKGLTRFTTLQNLFPESARRQATFKYFESIKTLTHTRRAPLFWLQYAIGCVVFKEYSRAEEYFATSYAFAGTRPSYDTYQIDNHYARFLIVRAIDEPSGADVMSAFREARTLLYRQMHKERLDYPYRVAKAFGEFYDTFSHSLSGAEKQEMVSAARQISERINKLPSSRRENRNVRECWDEMQRIIDQS